MSRRETPPARIRRYRVHSEPRETPDLHQLARLFIGMAQARARDAAAPDPHEPPASGPAAGARDGKEGAR